MKKKTIIIVGIFVSILILLVPIPMHLKDGGSVKYNTCRKKDDFQNKLLELQER